MTEPILVLIKSNPLESHRPVEGLRIALGLISGEHRVTLVLMNESPLLLAEDTDDLVDGDILKKYLPTLKELGQRFYIEENALEKAGLKKADDFIEAVSEEKIHRLIAQASRSLII